MVLGFLADVGFGHEARFHDLVQAECLPLSKFINNNVSSCAIQECPDIFHLFSFCYVLPHTAKCFLRIILSFFPVKNTIVTISENGISIALISSQKLLLTGKSTRL